MDKNCSDREKAWELRFTSYLKEHERSAESLRTLEEEGIPHNWLLDVLQIYADPNRRADDQARYRTAALATKRAIDKLMKALNKASESVKAFQASCDPSLLGDRLAIRDQLQSLKETLASGIEHLNEVSIENAKLASSKGEGISEEWLVHLVDGIEAATGTPHWSDVAYLIEAAYTAHNRRINADRDLVRKRFNRFCENFPRIREINQLSLLEWTGNLGLSRHVTRDLSKPWFVDFLRPWRNTTKPKKKRYGKIHKGDRKSPSTMTEFTALGVNLHPKKTG
jgi:hypothetical protein